MSFKNGEGDGEGDSDDIRENERASARERESDGNATFKPDPLCPRYRSSGPLLRPSCSYDDKKKHHFRFFFFFFLCLSPNRFIQSGADLAFLSSGGD